jgi:centrosomal protein CEP164
MINNNNNQSYTGFDEDENEEYQPSDEEIIEYAKYLGLNLETDQDLMWIAMEGLNAPVP